MQNVLTKFPDINVASLLNVKDKQNVPMAVRLIELIYDIDLEGAEKFELDILKEIKLFGKVCYLLLGTIANVRSNLCDQLTDLAQLSYMLFIIYRKHGTAFMTNDLYCDLQSTVQDSYICAAIAQKRGFDGKMLLYLLGTDQVSI